MRNNIGEWMHGFSGSCGRASNILEELYSIIKRFQLAWDLGYRTITLESCSKSAIDLILKMTIIFTRTQLFLVRFVSSGREIGL
jgi:hypothetical protein